MLYKITPQEEKAVLQDTLKYYKIAGSYSSLAAVMKDTKLPLTQKENVVLDCLSDFFLSKIIGDNDTESYSGLKDFYNKYANKDLFKAIGGISLTSDHIEELVAASHFYKEDLISLSLFFDVYQDEATAKKILETVPIDYVLRTVLLMPSLFSFTQDKVQEMISSEPFDLILFAASPYTKDFVTEENFNQSYKFFEHLFKSYIQEKFQIEEFQVYPQDEVYLGYDLELQEEIEGFKECIADLQEAYYDLFNQEFIVSTVAL